MTRFSHAVRSEFFPTVSDMPGVTPKLNPDTNQAMEMQSSGLAGMATGNGDGDFGAGWNAVGLPLSQ
jgi:hypothetical protein